MVFLDLFAGTGPIGKYLLSLGYAVIFFDILIGPHFDLSRKAVVDTVLGWMRAGRVFGFWLATPCVTTSRVRGLTYGPPRLRSTEHYRGCPTCPPISGSWPTKPTSSSTTLPASCGWPPPSASQAARRTLAHLCSGFSLRANACWPDGLMSLLTIALAASRCESGLGSS